MPGHVRLELLHRRVRGVPGPVVREHQRLDAAFGRDPAHRSDLTEDEIEKAIEEIRAAIDKFNPRKQGQ